jgi:hypothetical protein
MSTKISIGSISEGTMLQEDLLVAFTDALARIQQSGSGVFPVISEARLLIWRLESIANPEDLREYAASVIDKLQAVLNDHAPEGCYFGANPFDGASFGFWVHEGVQDEYPCVDELPCPHCSGHVSDQHYLVVNDHGNMSLYRLVEKKATTDDGERVVWRDWDEVWAIV